MWKGFMMKNVNTFLVNTITHTLVRSVIRKTKEIK